MKRFAALDAMRGLAALSVFFAHIYGVFSSHHTIWDLTPLYLLWAGGEAVILFFVLSGFVLTHRSQTGVPQTYPAFLAGRFFRIGVPHLLMLVLSVLAVLVFAARGLPGGAGLRWSEQVDWPAVTGHALMVVDFNSYAFNDVVWTLIHELRFALVFPAFMLLMTRLPLHRTLGVLAGMSVAAAAYVTVAGNPSAGFKTAYVYTVHYLLIFGLGGMLLMNLDAVQTRYLALTAARRALVLAGALLVYVYARMIYLVPQKWGWATMAVFNAFVADVLIAVAACVLMMAALSPGGLQRWLQTRWPQYLGRISFSLYLVHIPVLKTCLTLMPDVPRVFGVAVALPLVGLAAHGFHHLVEVPAHRLGRQVAQIVEGWRWRPIQPLQDSVFDDVNLAMPGHGDSGLSHRARQPEAPHHLGQ